MPSILTDSEVLVLKQAHRKIKDKRVADKIKAILMLHNKFTHDQISLALLFDRVTLSRYFKKFKAEGINGLLEMRYKGGQTKLTNLQEIELKSYLEVNTKRTVKEVASYILKKYKVSFSVIGVTKLLHRLGFSYKKPKVIPGKADKFKQEIFVEEYKKLKTSLKLNDQIYFADSTHPEHNTKPSYGWILKGKINDKYIKTNTGRERLNLTGAISLKDKKALVLSEKTINSDSIIKLFKKLLISQPRGKIYLILDNAPYHHSKKIKLWLKTHTRRVKLVFLPSYSPNLNIIERLWKFFHTKITWNHYFETFEEFKYQTLKFFRNLEKYKPELDTLLTDSFQMLPT